MLSQVGNRILQKLYATYRDDYLAENQGSNENDVERSFLNHITLFIDRDTNCERESFLSRMWRRARRKEVEKEIDSIR